MKILLYLSFREFHVCPETATIWGKSYEESLGKSSNSDRSSNNSDASDRKFNSMSISNFTATSILHESEKENTEVHSEKKMHAITTFRESLVSLDNCSMVDMSLETNLAEKKRAKTYEPANSTLMDMSLIDEPNQVPTDSKQQDDEVKMVLSPRKITFFHESSNLSVSVREKVLVRASESLAQQNILINCARDKDDVTLSLTEGEKNLISRKSICQQINMDLTLENFESRPSDNHRYNLRTKNNLKPKFKKTDLETQKKTLAEVEKNHTIHDVSDTAPIKVPSSTIKKGFADELMDFFMVDSPTRSVIGINAITKKDEEHFKNSKVIFSASKFAKSNPRINQTTAPKHPNKIILQDMDLSTEIMAVKIDETSAKSSNQRQTINNMQEMDLTTEVPPEKINRTTELSNQRQTINNVQEMDLTRDILVEKVDKTTGPYNHRNTINKVQDMDLNTDILIEKIDKTTCSSKNRQTINKVQDMSVNLSLNPEMSSKNHDRRTICETESMNMTNIERESTSTNSSNRPQAFKNSRKSVYTSLDIDETISKVAQKDMSFEHDIPRCEMTASQRRETSYGQNFSYTSNFFDLPAKQQTRSTIYDTNDLDETCSLESTEYLLLKTNKLFANPMMTASNDNTLSKSILLDEINLEAEDVVETIPVEKTMLSDVSMSVTNAYVNFPQDNFKIPSQRLTINNTNNSMNVSDIGVSMTNLKSKLRPTLYGTEDLEICSPASNQNYSKRSRKTVYEDGMNMSVNHVELPATAKASRKTIHQEETMDITVALVDHNAKSLIPQLMRKTIYQEEGMNITNTSCKISSPKPKYVPSSRNVRYTVYNEEAMNMSENMIEPHSLKVETEIDSRKTINQEVSIRQLEESTSSAANNELRPLPSRHSIYVPHEMSGIELGDRPSVIMHGSIIDTAQDEIVTNISGVKSLGAIPKTFANRKTTHVVKDMDTGNTSQQQNVIDSPENKKPMIFEIYQDSIKKSTKLLNITDAEIPLYDCNSPATKEDTDDMLDNESFPLIEESNDEFQVDNEESDDMQLSIVTPNYLSENFKDFINITLASPQGSSARTSSSNISIMSIQGTASTSIDDKFQKMDEFLEQLEKGVEKPRLKIDEFLAKLNIPIRETPKQLPIFDEDYFERKFREVQEQFEEATRLEKEMIVPQFPEIPTFTFLWKNHMEW